MNQSLIIFHVFGLYFDDKQTIYFPIIFFLKRGVASVLSRLYSSLMLFHSFLA